MKNTSSGFRINIGGKAGINLDSSNRDFRVMLKTMTDLPKGISNRDLIKKALAKAKAMGNKELK